jgi:hypothetical protein
LHAKSFKPNIFKKAIEETATKRGSLAAIRDYEKAMQNIAANERMHGFWEKYQKDYAYAANIRFNDICKLIIDILNGLGF